MPKQTNVSESEKSKVFIICIFVGASKISYASPCSSVDRALASGARSRRFESFQGHFLLAYPSFLMGQAIFIEPLTISPLSHTMK